MSNEEVFTHAIKKYNTNELVKYLQKKGLKLDDDDFTIIRKEKIAGLDFLELTKEEFRSIGFALGPATRLVKFVTELKEAKAPLHEQKQPGFQENDKFQTAETNKVTELKEAEAPLHEQKQPEGSQENDKSQTAETNEVKFITELKEAKAPLHEQKQSEDFRENNNLQTAETSEKIHDPCVNISTTTSERSLNETYLPEIASQRLRYYEIWNRPYVDWPCLEEFSNYLHDVAKDRVHNSFKMEIKVLRELFTKDHPAQLCLTYLEAQLKMRQIPRKIQKTCRRKVAKAIKLLTKKEVVKEEIEIAKNSVIADGYHRINKHYEDYHEASTQLVKRNLSDDGINEPLATKK
ncbi:5116_t:CDS:2, partial [Paraglomus brasilianum]